MKTVLITGCSSGFGALMVEAFLARGWRVLATLRDAEARRSSFTQQTAKFGDQLVVLDLDVTDAKSRAKVADFLRANLRGRLDVLINNAGRGVFTTLEDASHEQIRQQMELNYYAAAEMMRDFLPFLRASRGRIINVSSLLGFSGFPLAGLYSASKFALEGLSESMRYELAHVGVQIALLEPGSFPNTKFSATREWGGKTMDAGSPYAIMNLKTQAWFNSRATQASDGTHGLGGPNPMMVVDKAVWLAECRRMPMRVTAGHDATALSFIRRILPQRLYFALLERALKAMM